MKILPNWNAWGKKTIGRNFLKTESDISVTVPSHMRKGIAGLVLTCTRTKAKKIASHTKFKVIYFGTCAQNPVAEIFTFLWQSI